MPYYEFELVTDATYQHQGGMILEDEQGAADQAERLAAELTLVRPDSVPQFRNSGSRSKQRRNLSHRSRHCCNPETPPRSQQIFVPAVTKRSCCSTGRPSGSVTAKQPKLTEAGSTPLPASRPHLSSLDPRRRMPLQYIRRSSIRKCASRIRLCPERCGPTSSGAYIPDTSAVR